MAEEESRVHKASEVHKRRAPKKAHAMASAEAPAGGFAGAAAETRAGKPDPSESREFVETPEGAPTEPPEPVTHELQDLEEPAHHAEEAPKRKRWGMRIAVAAGCLVVAAVLVAAGFYAGSRWLRYNDEHDIEGTWYVDGTDTAIAFADGSIALNSDTSYNYEIDPTAKTIAYSLGGLSGQGRYWFSDDRSVLVITDGAGYTMWSTFADDLAYDVRRFFGEEGLPAGEDSIVLTKVITLARDDEPTASADSGDQEAGEGLESTGKKDEFSDLSISDVLVRDDDAGEGEEFQE